MKDNNYLQENNPTSRYIKSLDKKVFTKEEEKDFLQGIKFSSPALKESLKKEFIEHNLRLVVATASHYTKDMDLLAELIQQGNVGLMEALDSFDMEKDNKFSSWAVFWIEKEIKAYLRDNRLIKIKKHLYPQIREYNEKKKSLSNILAKEVTDEEISKELGWSLEKTNFIGSLIKNVSSLNEKIDVDNEEKEMGEYIPSDTSVEDTLMEKNMIADVRNLLETAGLKEREKEVLLYRYGFYTDGELSRKKIGEILNVGRESIRMDEKKALIKLKRIAKEKGYDDYLR